MGVGHPICDQSRTLLAVAAVNERAHHQLLARLLPQDTLVDRSARVLCPSVKKMSLRHVHVNSASKALAFFKSAVSKPSVNQL